MALGRHRRAPCAATIWFHSTHDLLDVEPVWLKPFSRPSIRNRSESRKKKPCRLTVMWREILVNLTNDVPGGCWPTGKKTHQRTFKKPRTSCASIESEVITVAKCGFPFALQA